MSYRYQVLSGEPDTEVTYALCSCSLSTAPLLGHYFTCQLIQELLDQFYYVQGPEEMVLSSGSSQSDRGG